MALLAVEHITMKFGGLVAVNDFDLALEKNEIVGLIGPNGAGKTTVFNMIAGYYIPTEGAIRFMGNPIGGRKPTRSPRQASPGPSRTSGCSPSCPSSRT